MYKLLKREIVIVVIFFSFAGGTHAQQGEQGGNNGDSFPFSTLPGREFTLEINHELMQGLNPDLKRPNILIKENMLLGAPLQFELPLYENWHRPIYNELNLYRGMLNSNQISYPVLGKNAFYLSGTQDFMPGISSMNSMTAGFMIQPTDNWMIDISGSAVKYQDLIGIHNDFSINASTHIFLSDNWIINLFGGYSMNGIHNVIEGFDMRSPFAPVSYFGGSLEFVITDGFSLEGGIRREYNPWLRTWESVYFIVPKLNLGLFRRVSESQQERTDRLIKAYNNDW